MADGWRQCGLALGLCGLFAAAEPAPLRRVALRIEVGQTEAVLGPTLPGLRASLGRELRAEGVELVPEGEARDLPRLSLLVNACRVWGTDQTEIKVMGRLAASPAPAGGSVARLREAVSQIIVQDGRRLAMVLNGASLAVARGLLSHADESGTGSGTAWLLPPGPPGATRVEGRTMKVDGALPPLDYPMEIRAMRLGGPVSMDVLVDAEGRVVQAAVTEGELPLAEPALTYLGGLRFRVPPELRERAPLGFRLSIRYRLPPVCSVSRAVLEIVDGEMKEPGLQPEKEALQGALREALGKEGVQCVDAPATGDPELRDLRIVVETLRAPGNLCLYCVRARVSRHADRQAAAIGAASPEVFVDGLVAGQQGEAGFRESLTRAVKGLLRSVVDPPNPEKGPLREGSPTAADPGVVDFDFSQIRIKRQPPVPPYPPGARQKRIQGTVVVEIEVDEEGRPVRGTAHKGPAELMLTALAYALDWSFEPAKLNGKPAKARFRLTMPFRLR